MFFWRVGIYHTVKWLIEDIQTETRNFRMFSIVYHWHCKNSCETFFKDQIWVELVRIYWSPPMSIIPRSSVSFIVPRIFIDKAVKLKPKAEISIIWINIRFYSIIHWYGYSMIWFISSAVADFVPCLTTIYLCLRGTQWYLNGLWNGSARKSYLLTFWVFAASARFDLKFVNTIENEWMN